MTYNEIINTVQKDKRGKTNLKMDCTQFDTFSVLHSDKCTILVDNDVAKDIKDRKWCVDSGGYPIARFGKTNIRLHDYVMAKTYKQKPEASFVDHINQDKLDNRRTNLRFVDGLRSSMNMPLRSDNSTGVTGVSNRLKGGSKGYRAYITVNKKRIDLGTYKTLEDATNARRAAEDHYGFTTKSGKNFIDFLDSYMEE